MKFNFKKLILLSLSFSLFLFIPSIDPAHGLCAKGTECLRIPGNGETRFYRDGDCSIIKNSNPLDAFIGVRNRTPINEWSEFKLNRPSYLTLSDCPFECGEYFSDSRDGKTYGTVQIGTQCWMLGNLNLSAGLSHPGDYGYPDNDSNNTSLYGLLYPWDVAKNICPSGWKLPTQSEWSTLISFVGSSPGTKLKSSSYWDDYSCNCTSCGWFNLSTCCDACSGNGSDNYGFGALPAGGRFVHSYGGIGQWASFWTATVGSESTLAIKADFSHNSSSVTLEDGVVSGSYYSVRCIQE